MSATEFAILKMDDGRSLPKRCMRRNLPVGGERIENEAKRARRNGGCGRMVFAIWECSDNFRSWVAGGA